MKKVFGLGIFLLHITMMQCMLPTNTKTGDLENFELGMAACETQDLDNAKRYFQRIIQDKPCAEALNYLAQLYEEKDDMDNTVDCLQQAAIKGNKCALYALIEIGQEYRKDFNYYLPKIDKTDVINAINELGIVYYSYRDLHRATKYFKLAVQHHHADALENLKMAYEEKSAIEAVIQYYESAPRHYYDQAQ